MGSRYLTEMPGVLRGAGLTVVEEPGHESRGRSSGGFDFNPFACFVHNTASGGGNTEGDVEYMTYNADAAPIANAMVDDNGVWYWMASGATNTNGTGEGRQFSRGFVPVDQANTHVVGVECRNNGVGEGWPQVQIDSMFAGVAAINAALGNQPTDVDTHQSYTDRKIDPATAGAVEGPWQPGSVTSSGSWSADDLRAEFANRAGAPVPPPTQPPQPPSTPGDDDKMLWIMKKIDTDSYHIADGVTRTFTVSPQVLVDAAVRSGRPLRDAASGREVTHISQVGAIAGGDIDAFGNSVDDD